MHKDLSLSVAKTLAEEIDRGLRGQGLCDVRRRGRSRRRDDGRDARRQRPPAHHGERAAQGLHRDDLQADHGGIRQEAATTPIQSAHQQVTLPNVIAIPGGQPIKAGNEVIGGIGAVRLARRRRRLRQCRHGKVKDQLQVSSRHAGHSADRAKSRRTGSILRPLSRPPQDDVLHRLLKFQHEIVDRHGRLVAREVVGVVGVAPEIAFGDELETGRLDFLAAASLLRCDAASC